jgi:phosphatidylinositol alpha-1,6-mannosyltransferase
MLVAVFPELSEVGGIQQVGRHFCAVVAERARKRNEQCHLFGLNDRPGHGSFNVGDHQYDFTGFGRNKGALLSALFRLALRTETLYLGHVNLAPLGLLLRSVRPRLDYCVLTYGVEVWEPLPVFRRLGLQRADRVLSVSAFTASEMVKAQKVNAERIFVIFPSLDPSFTQGPCDGASLPLPPGGRMLLTVGRLVSAEPGKGIDSVIKVLPKVIEAIPDLFYVIVGAGDLQPPLEEMARKSSAHDHIFFLGKLPIEQLKGCYSRAEVFVMPSRQEGFGIVFLEAMVFAKPVIAGDHGGAPEVVQDGVTGFSVSPDDLDTLTGRLTQLLQDKSLRVKMGNAGRQRIREDFTFMRFEEKLNAILDTPD